MDVLRDVREISRGIHPAILSERGLEPAVKALARRSPVPVDLTVRVAGRLPDHVELGAYYIVSEALANVAKHANAEMVMVCVEAGRGVLSLSVRDDGVGGADPDGSGLTGLRERAEALGGTLTADQPVRPWYQRRRQAARRGPLIPGANQSIASTSAARQAGTSNTVGVFRVAAAAASDRSTSRVSARAAWQPYPRARETISTPGMSSPGRPVSPRLPRMP